MSRFIHRLASGLTGAMVSRFQETSIDSDSTTQGYSDLDLGFELIPFFLHPPVCQAVELAERVCGAVTRLRETWQLEVETQCLGLAKVVQYG